MFKRIKNLWNQSEQPIYLDLTKLNRDQLKILLEALNEPGVITSVPEEALGDGKAVFFGEGTESEYKEFEKEEQGMKGWIDRLKNL